MNIEQIQQTLALTWQATNLGIGIFKLDHSETNGCIIFDETSQVIFPSMYKFPSQPQIRADLAFYADPSRKKILNAERVLQCESSALHNFKNPARYFQNVHNLFKALEEKEFEGTSAVFGHLYNDLDGQRKWGWVRIEYHQNDIIRSSFEDAFADLNAATENGDEEKITHARNLLTYMTGANWTRADKILLVGTLSDGYGWQWLGDASLCSEEELNNFGGDADFKSVSCICGFSKNIAWGIGYTGSYISQMHLAYKQHKEKNPDCLHKLS